MAIKKYNPTTSSRRHYTTLVREEITKLKPEKSLIIARQKNAGRNSQGKITIRFRGGGHKYLYRVVDFKMKKYDMPATVTAIEYDPGRSAYIALISYKDDTKAYIIAPQGLKVGDQVISGQEVPVKTGNRMPLSQIPLGVPVHNIEMAENAGGAIIRSAGTSAQLIAKEGDWVLLKMPSGEIRKFFKNNWASIGVVSNPDHFNVTIGNAGRYRHMGWRPRVRGKAMNPVDHPHGGGEGKNPIGMPGPKSPWGKPTLGYKTRKRKYTNAMIVRDRRK